MPWATGGVVNFKLDLIHLIGALRTRWMTLDIRAN